MGMLNRIVNYENPKSTANKLRQKRFNFFLKCIEDHRQPIKILDIGGTESFWRNRNFANNPSYIIHLVNLTKEKVTASNITSEVGNATNLSNFRDEEFDIVFSNSVIEHLYSWDNQVLMANEIVRLGKYFFIQTPNKLFPIEPHFLFPLFQFFPKNFKLMLLTKTKLVRGRRYAKPFAEEKLNELKLLSKKNLRQLFPQASIYEEKIVGLFNKSFIVHNFLR